MEEFKPIKMRLLEAHEIFVDLGFDDEFLGRTEKGNCESCAKNDQA